MFDWDDQELVDILWAGAEDTSDHIVPFPRGCEELPADVPGDLIKTPQNEEIANGKMSKQKKPVSSSELDGVKQEISFEFDNNKILSVDGDSVDSWSKSLAKVSKNSRDKPTKQDGGSQILQDLSDDKESDLVGYDWHTIGSFEDLDRMFSIGDTEFGCTSLENTDELWPCSMDYSSFASGAPSTSDQCGKTEDMLDQDQPCSLGYSNMNDLTRCFPQKKLAEFKNHPFGDNKIDRDMVSKTLQVDSDFSTGKVSVPTEFSDKVDRQKYILRRRKRSGEDSKARPYQDLPKTWFSSENQFLQLEDHHAKTGQSPAFKGINRQIKFPETASSPYNKFTTALFSPSGHTHVHIQDPFTPILPQFHSSSKVPSGRSKTLNKFPASSANPLTMTPEEKIKKLRRRQQLRAMLAIQKQQKQFGHDTSESQQSIYQKYTIPDQLQLAGGNLEVDVSTLNMNSPAEQDYSGTMSLASDDCCPESAILYRLQNIVAKTFN
nr:PREDICTED: protein LNK2 isoform X2 [Daucus carota subsp. sativus]